MAVTSPCPQSGLRERLSALVQHADMDGAIEAGLIEFVPCSGSCCADVEPLLAAQAQLRNAWSARERYRSRQARLQRRADERQARRSAAITPAYAPIASGDMDSSPAPAPPQARPALPASAAAILARAKAKAAGRTLE